MFNTDKKTNDTYIMFRATKKQREELNKIANSYGYKTSDFIKSAINNFIKELENKNK